jgi:hypothetical protein
LDFTMTPADPPPARPGWPLESTSMHPLYRRALWASAAFCTPLWAAAIAGAHGFVGDRFFPPTITSDDPFAVDELGVPTITAFNTPASPGTPESRTFDFGYEFDKEILPHFAIGVSDDYFNQTGHGGPSAHGWGTVELSAKYELLHDEPHEFILSVGVLGDIGHSGNVETSDPFSTVTPTLYFGKGFGDLPKSVDLLRPLALTGTFGQTFSTSAAGANAFEWAFALEYSLPYLQSEVRDVGLPKPIDDLIPLCEFTFSTQENRDGRGETTGTFNPGVLYENAYFQLGAEALIPVNHDSGAHVGLVVQSWIFIDDLFPQIFGHPLFGGEGE